MPWTWPQRRGPAGWGRSTGRRPGVEIYESIVIVKSWINFLSWLLIGCSCSCIANQKPACLLTQLLTMTSTHKFPSLVPADADVELHGVHAGGQTGGGGGGGVLARRLGIAARGANH